MINLSAYTKKNQKKPKNQKKKISSYVIAYALRNPVSLASVIERRFRYEISVFRLGKLLKLEEETRETYESSRWKSGRLK